MKRITILSVLFCLVSLVTMAQEGTAPYDYYEEPDSLVVRDQPVSVSMMTGASVATGSNGGSAFSTYVAPYVSYKLNPRWKVGVGASLVKTNFDRWKSYSLADEQAASGSVINQQVFVRAEYQASQRMVLSGTIYQNMLTLQSVNGEQSPFSLPGTSYALGMQYELTKGLMLGVEFRQSRGSYLQSPFFPYQSPFGTFGSW